MNMKKNSGLKVYAVYRPSADDTAVVEALKKLAAMIGRQIAREYLAGTLVNPQSEPDGAYPPTWDG